MKKDQIIDILQDKDTQAYLKDMGIAHLYLFGSHVKGNTTKESYIDLLYEQSKDMGWEFFDVLNFLEKKMNVKVDLVSKEYINKRIKKSILSECKSIFL